MVVRSTLGSPVLFRQPRIGRFEKEFSVYKFRTMTDARDEHGELLSDAARLPKAGRILRTLSLDELPQLLNVARGEMSLIGPRPLLVRYLPHYTSEERKRHWVRPGITGLAQVTGRNSVLWDQRLLLDVSYVDRASLALDAKVLGLTIKQVLIREGVSVIAGESGEPLDVVRSYPRRGAVALRRFERSDIPYRVRWMTDDATREHMTIPDGISEESTTEWLKSIRADPQRDDFTVYDTSTFECVAMIGVKTTAEHPLPELYIFVDPSRHGSGLGRRSLELLFDWMSETGKYGGCHLSVSARNTAAVHLYRNFGFTEASSTPQDRLTMELSVEDWRIRDRE